MPVLVTAGVLLTRLEWSRMPPTLAAAGEPLPPFSVRGDPNSQDRVKLIVHGVCLWVGVGCGRVCVDVCVCVCVCVCEGGKVCLGGWGLECVLACGPVWV